MGMTPRRSAHARHSLIVAERATRAEGPASALRSAPQKLNLALTWISLPGVVTSVSDPKPAVFTKRFGVPRLVWFSALKNSPRVSSFKSSRSEKLRTTPKSAVCIPGPTTAFLPVLPNVYAGGVANADGLNQFVAFRVFG